MFPTSSRSRTQHQRTVDAAKAYQHESPPTITHLNEGIDSCYGVQSVSSWGEQSQEDLEMPSSDTGDIPYAEQEDENVDDDAMDEMDEPKGEGESTPDGIDSLTSSNIIPPSGLGLGIRPDDNWLNNLPNIHPHSLHQQNTITRPIHTKPEQRIVPPSPEDTVHPLEHQLPSHQHIPSTSQALHSDSNMEDSSLPQAIEANHQQLTLDHITRSFDSPYLPNTSEPSSPASFTSMPSYVASLSSLSRTSSISPMGIAEYNHQHPHHHGTGNLMMGSDELVLPTLSLPSESLSLHMSLSKWSGEVQHDSEGGLGIILLGERDHIERTLRKLKEVEELVEIRNGVGLVRDGKLVLRLVTNLRSIELAQNKVLHTYHTLNGLLHPQLREDSAAQAELRRLVEGYMGRSEWIHAVLNLNEDVSSESLAHIIPVIHTHTQPTSPEIANETSNITAKTPSVRQSEIEPTPRPSDETSGYFAPRNRTPSPSSSRDSSPIRSVRDTAQDQVSGLLRDPSSIIQKSIDAFLSWRSTQTYNIPHHEALSIFAEPTGNGDRTMTSSYTSASSGVGAMPTVARAQGGGEWEATLSRRVAQRRESDISRDRSFITSRGGSSVPGQGLGQGQRSSRRRRSNEKTDKSKADREREREREKDCLPPLFPISRSTPNNPAGGKGLGLGINNLLDKTFVKGIRKWTKGWRGLLVVGLVVAVGWGCWMTKRG